MKNLIAVLIVASVTAIDQGAWLITVAGSGTSNRVPVEDPSIYVTLTRFSWAEGVVDTRIQFQGSKQRPTVLSVEGNILILDQEVTFITGQRASFPYCGNGPDIGAVESDCTCGNEPLFEGVCSFRRPVPPTVY